MTDTIHRPEGTEPGSTAPARAAAAGRSRIGPMGYGSGPVLAAGIMVGGAVLFAGWGMTQILTADESSATETASVSTQDPGAGEEGTVTVTLPDKDGNGVADAFEPKDGEASPDDDGSTGKGDEDEVGATPPAPEPKPETRVYIIEPGDTLTEISGETGVPVGVLVEKNRIQDPNLIYAGASLLIPPAG